MNYLLSIIIPTKDRYQYLKPLVNLLLSFKSNDFEIVIQDNSIENQSFLKFLETHNDKRIKYFHTKEEISIIENCDNAISNTSGEYICFIGDDDGVTFEIIKFCSWMKKENINAAYFDKGVYIWPDLTGKYSFSSTAATLKINKINGNVKFLNAKSELNKVCKLGGYKMLNLPRLYHGIVSKKTLEQVYEKSGSYFPGPSPDMANAVAIANYIDKCVFVKAPIVVSGSSVKSGAGQGLKHKHQRKLSDAKHLPKETEEEWTKEIPLFWSAPTIWAESVIKSASRCNIKIKLNFSFLYAACLIFNNEYNQEITRVIQEYCKDGKKNKMLFKFRIFINKIIIYKYRFQSLVKNLKYKYVTLKFSNLQYTDIPDINEAVGLIQEQMDKKQYIWKNK